MFSACLLLCKLETPERQDTIKKTYTKSIRNFYNTTRYFQFNLAAKLQFVLSTCVQCKRYLIQSENSQLHYEFYI